MTAGRGSNELKLKPTAIHIRKPIRWSASWLIKLCPDKSIRFVVD